MFKPKKDRALWEMAYEHVQDMSVGDVITYDEFSEFIDQDILKCRTVVYKLAKEMLKKQKRTLKSVRNVGYRIIDKLEIMNKAEERQERAEKQIKVGNFEINHIDTVKLTVEEKTKLQNFMAYNANIRAAFSNTISRIEKAQVVTQIAQDFTENEIAKLKSLIQV